MVLNSAPPIANDREALPCNERVGKRDETTGLVQLQWQSSSPTNGA